MNRVTLQGGPGDGDTVLVSDDVIRHGMYYYIKRPTLDELVNTYRYERKADKTYAYVIKCRLVDGDYGYIGVCAL